MRLSLPTLNGNCATRTSRWPPSASLASSVTGVSAASVATGAETMTDSVLYIPLSRAISMPSRRRGLNSLSCTRLGDSDCAGTGVCGLNLFQYRQTHLRFRSSGRFPVGNGRSGAVRANDTPPPSHPRRSGQQFHTGRGGCRGSRPSVRRHQPPQFLEPVEDHDALGRPGHDLIARV